MQGKKITFIVASLMAIGAYTQTTPPCTGFSKLDPTGTSCYICPGDFCDSCSADFKCDQYALCTGPAELPNVAGTACFSCDVSDCLNCLAADYCQQCDTGFNLNQRDGTCYKCDNALCSDCDPTNTAVCT